MNKCPQGQIRTKRGKVCIVPFKLRPGTLSKFGYKNVKTMTETARHRALNKVLKHGNESPLALFRRLNALMVLFEYKDPRLSKIFKNDRDYIRNKFV